VLLGTIVVCVAMYEGIRRVAPLRFLFGMKPGRRDAAALGDATITSSRTEAS
jgi:hypothetical protein